VGSVLSIGLYVKVLFGLQLVDCLLFALLALFVHVLVNQKYLGHLVALLAYGFIAFAPNLGIEHKLLIFTASPRWSYTDMVGFSPSLGPWLWFKGYWACLGAVIGGGGAAFLGTGPGGQFCFAASLWLAVASHVPQSWFLRWQVVCILLCGGFIFYNTNVMHDYTSSVRNNRSSALSMKSATNST
jgi:hypothetical protein